MYQFVLANLLLLPFVFLKPNAALAMVLKSEDGVGSDPVQKNLMMRHVIET